MGAAVMTKKMIGCCCKLYISDSKDSGNGHAITTAFARHPLAPLLHTFHDLHYNRVGYTLAGLLSSPDSCLPLHTAVLDIVRLALSLTDLQQHSGSHPKLGVVDHVCFHPLGAATSPAVASLAQSVARDIGLRLAVPTYVYGAAHPESRSLHVIRRALGYFSPDAQGQWVGAPSSSLSLTPDFGPPVASPKSGVVTVGACPWIANYNIPVCSTDLQLGRRIAKRLSTRGGGLPAVEAMALRHGENRMEIACNLIDFKLTSADLVQEEVTRLAEKDGLTVESGYFTDFSEDQITEMASQKLYHGE